MSVEKGIFEEKKEELAKYLSELFLLMTKTGDKFFELFDKLILKKLSKKTAEERWGGIVLFDSSKIKAEQEARKARTEQLRGAFSGAELLVVNTGTEKKVKAVVAMAQNLGYQDIHLNSGRVILQPSQKDEPMRPRAADVSLFKARTARDEYLIKHFPELSFWLYQMNLALKYDLPDLIVKELTAKKVFYGGDINALVIDPETGLYVESHKLKRRYPTSLPDSERQKLHQRLYRRYVTPPGGVARVIWDASSTYLNGGEHVVSDFIEVRAKPLPKELFYQYVWAAAENGMELASNTHFEAFEVMNEVGIESTSRLPAELAARGYTLKNFRQSAKPEELAAIHATVNTNVPFYVA